MSSHQIERVKNYLKIYHMEDRLQEFNESSATVELAAQVLNVEQGRIAKSISLESGEGCIIIVAAGDSKIDNAKFKAEFGHKAKLLSPEKVESLTGYQVGGVCPFDNPSGAFVYCDVSLRHFDYIYPAGGNSSSCVGLTCDELFEVSKSKKWVNVCKSLENTEDSKV